jgi:hypothetical protein
VNRPDPVNGRRRVANAALVAALSAAIVATPAITGAESANAGIGNHGSLSRFATKFKFRSETKADKSKAVDRPTAEASTSVAAQTTSATPPARTTPTQSDQRKRHRFFRLFQRKHNMTREELIAKFRDENASVTKTDMVADLKATTQTAPAAKKTFREKAKESRDRVKDWYRNKVVAWKQETAENRAKKLRAKADRIEAKLRTQTGWDAKRQQRARNSVEILRLDAKHAEERAAKLKAQQPA